VAVTTYSALEASVKTAKSRGPWQSWNIYGLAAQTLCTNISLGAGLTGSTIEGITILPQYCKIPKVAVAFGAIDSLTGDTFNILVENAGNGTPGGFSTGIVGTAYTAGQLQGTGYPDNSQVWGYPAQNAPALPTSYGAGPVFFPTGACLFAQDVGFNVTNFPSATTSGGGAVLATTNWDGVFAAGTILTLRPVTNASTGSVANLTIVLFVEPLDDYISDDAAVPIQNW
jgi:hypothetical protein